MRLATAMLILGSFAFGYNVATALHELGHALAVWAVGGRVESITVHPFSWSYTKYASCPPEHRELCAWAGGAFGLASAMTLTVLARRLRSVYAAPLQMTGLAACFYNGLYYVVDVLARTGGDAQFLHENGTPRWVLLGCGAAAIGLGLFTASWVLSSFGARKSDRLRDRVITYELGFGPYLAAMWLHHVVTGHEVRLWTIYFVAGVVLVAAVAAISIPLVRRGRGDDTPVVGRGPAVFSLVLGVLVVLLELRFTA
jgi:hypothetical protein